MEYRVADGIMSDEVGGGLPQAYRALGELLDREDRCNELADYVASIYVTLAQIKEAVPEEERKTVVMGLGENALSMCHSDSLTALMLEAFGINYASIENAESNVITLLERTKPDFVLLAPNYFDDEASSNAFFEFWGNLSSSYGFDYSTVPSYPDYWLGFSPFATQTIGAVWAASSIYGKYIDFDISDFVQEYYSLLFTLELDEEYLRDVLIAQPFPISCNEDASSCSSEYSSPSVDLLSSVALATSTSNLSSGYGRSGGGSSTTTKNYPVYVLFTGIRVGGSDDPVPYFDHTAMMVSSSIANYYYYYGFASGEAVEIVTTGWQGYLSSHIASTVYTSTSKFIDPLAKQLVYAPEHTGFFSTGSLVVDRLGHWANTGQQDGNVDSNDNGVDDANEESGHYRYIKFNLASNGERTALIGTCDDLRQECFDANKGGNLCGTGATGISTLYHLLSHNCYDVVSELLATVGYEIHYHNYTAPAVLMLIAAALTAVGSPLGVALATIVAGMTFTDTIPNIPTLVYDEFEKVTRNGSEVSATLLEFRGREE